MDTQFQISIRNAKGLDLNFIYATLINSFCVDRVGGKTCPDRIFQSEYRQVLDHILSNPLTVTRIACKPDEPEVIYGYLIGEPPNTLHYTFIKEDFRRLGIAAALFDNLFGHLSPICNTHETKTSRRLYMARNKQEPALIHNPYLLYKKGEYECPTKS